MITLTHNIFYLYTQSFNVECARCKGRLLCGRLRCPLLEKFRLRTAKIEVGEIEKPTPPSVFVGRYGYPKVFVGPLIATREDNPEFLDSPWLWKGRIEDIIAIRMSLIRGMKLVDVRSGGRFIETLQEATASIRHVFLEGRIERVIEKPIFDDVLQPIGVAARIEDLRLVENPKIPREVEKVWNDEVKAVDAVRLLFDAGFNTYYIQRLFSIGMLGIEKRLVPTRWSITAVHDILGESLKQEVAEFEPIDEAMFFSYEHFGNRFEILILPGEYSFNLIEIWNKRSFWSPDSTWMGYDGETIAKKKRYSILGGGYYAARLPVLKFLRKIRRKGKVFVLREIKPEYYAPLGVWVVEEGVRRAFALGRRDVGYEKIRSFLRKFRYQTTLADFQP